MMDLLSLIFIIKEILLCFFVLIQVLFSKFDVNKLAWLIEIYDTDFSDHDSPYPCCEHVLQHDLR
jgi:hypothetical protein